MLAEPDSRQLALAEAPLVCLHQEGELRPPYQMSQIVLGLHQTLNPQGARLKGLGWGRSKAECRNPIV